MGFFSFKTQDTNQSIPNKHSKRVLIPVKMLDNKGNVYCEDAYDGYGVFGGVDYFALLAEMNGHTGTKDDLMVIGVDLYFEPTDDIIYPMIVTQNYDAQWEDLGAPEGCEFQGFFY